METLEAQRVRIEIMKLWLAYADLNKRFNLVSATKPLFSRVRNAIVCLVWRGGAMPHFIKFATLRPLAGHCDIILHRRNHHC